MPELLQISADGLRLPSAQTLRRLSLVFKREHFVRLPGFVHPSLLPVLVKQLRSASFYERRHKGIALEACLKENPALHALRFCANDPALFRVIRNITGCHEIGCFNGRVYRMEMGRGHYDSWHSDISPGQGRMVAMSVNLSPKIYRGGTLELRRRKTEEIMARIPNTGLGDAILFRVAPFLDHRVTEVQSPAPKTAFAGWFQSRPKPRVRSVKKSFRPATASVKAYRASSGILSQSRECGRVLCRLSDGQCFGLEGVAADLWPLLQEKRSLPSLVHRLRQSYDAPASVLEKDAQVFLGVLRSQGLVE